MLGRARYNQDSKTIIYEKVLCTVNYGEFIFGYKAWSNSTGISYQRLRGLVSKLIDDEMIKVKKQCSRYTIYEIVNYSKFNSQETKEIQGASDIDNSQVTASQQSGNSQVTTNKEGNKKVKKDKKDISNMFADYTDSPELAEALNEFVKMRLSIKKPLTERAVKIMLDKLDDFGRTDYEKIQVLNQSIMNCYQGIFPLKHQAKNKPDYRNITTNSINDFFTGRGTSDNKRFDSETTEDGRDIETIDVSVS
jgi:hypothetical protein